MGDLDEGQERLTLALYGGALAAVGVLLIAFVLYVQSIAPLIGQVNQTIALLNAGATTVEEPTDVGGTPAAVAAPTAATQPAATDVRVADARTQLLLLLASAVPGGLMVGWALAGGRVRGVAVAVASFAALALLAFAFGDAATAAPPFGLPPGIWFALLLLLAPALTVAAALLAQAGTALGRRVQLALLTLPPLALAAGLTLRFGWWIVPVAWVALPIAAASGPWLLGRGTPAEQRL